MSSGGLKKNEKSSKKMFDMGRGGLYKADLCSAKRLEKQSETRSGPRQTVSAEWKKGVDKGIRLRLSSAIVKK